MKLIIDIPEEKIVIEYGEVISIGRNNDKELADYIFAGTPLETHDEEIIKETVASIWGKPPYTEMLDSIKADIERYQADCDLSCSDDSNCRTCNNITFGTIYQIIDKYRKGDKE